MGISMNPKISDEWEEVPEPEVSNQWEEVGSERKEEPKKKTSEFVREEDINKFEALKERTQAFKTLWGDKPLSNSVLKGLSLGLTENIPGLEASKEGLLPYLSEVGSEFIPISGLMKGFETGLTKLAAKSPVFQKQLSSLARLVGVPFMTGATLEGAKTVTKGEIPEPEDLVKHGLIWVALETALRGLGKVHEFHSALSNKASATGKTNFSVLNDTMNTLREQGVDFKTSDIAATKALEVLEQPLTQAERTAAEIRLSQPIRGEQKAIEEEALKPQKITSKDLSSKRISQDKTDRMFKDKVSFSEPYIPEKIDFRKEAESLEESALNTEIENSGKRAATEEELGTNIKSEIETNLERERKANAPLYKEAEEAAEGIIHVPKEAVKEAGEKLIKLSRLKTKPSDYNIVIKNIEDALKDMGYVIQRDTDGVISQIIQDKEVVLSDSIELARRLNNLIDYETKDPNVRNVLKPIVRSLKRDIRKGLSANPDGLTAFELAEAEHGRIAEKYGNEAIEKIRGTEAGEKVVKNLMSPTNLKNIKETVSKNQWEQIEREILEKLKGQNYDKAKSQFREIEKFLTPENRELGNKLIESKNPHNPSARISLTKEGILNDMANAFNNGTRPSKTLDLWKTKQGQKIIQETFKDSPNWKTVKNYLEQQSFQDMVSTVMKDGHIDFKEFNKNMKDPVFQNNIIEQGGEDAFEFFSNLEQNAQKLQKNINLIDRIPTPQEASLGIKELEGRIKKPGQRVATVGKESIKEAALFKKELQKSDLNKGKNILERMVRKDYPMKAKIDDWNGWMKESLGLTAKGALSIFGIAKLGLMKGVPAVGLTMVGYRIMNKLLTSKKVRQAFMQAVKKQHDPVSFIMAIDAFEKAVEEE